MCPWEKSLKKILTFCGKDLGEESESSCKLFSKFWQSIKFEKQLRGKSHFYEKTWSQNLDKKLRENGQNFWAS